MAKGDFHDAPYDEGTLTKLELFQLYARAWYPVFLSSKEAYWPEVHVFDYFAGPGVDQNGTPGSPVRIVQEALNCLHKLQDGTRSLHFHFFDKSQDKVGQLKYLLDPMVARLPNTTCEVLPFEFETAFKNSIPILNSPKTANLVLLDPCGVNFVDEDIFRQVSAAPTTDFLLFVASNFLHRFAKHPSIKLKINRPDDFYHCHKAVVELYRQWTPENRRYYLHPFSILKPKSNNIYGVIFGTSHPLAMDKFLTLGWDKDKLNGEGNFDIHREDFQEDAPFLAGLDMFQPTKLSAFERALEVSILDGKCTDEWQVVQLCFQHGVKRQHAKAILQKLQTAGAIEANFFVPDLREKSPRVIKLN